MWKSSCFVVLMLCAISINVLAQEAKPTKEQGIAYILNVLTDFQSDLSSPERTSVIKEIIVTDCTLNMKYKREVSSDGFIVSIDSEIEVNLAKIENIFRYSTDGDAQIKRSA